MKNYIQLSFTLFLIMKLCLIIIAVTNTEVTTLMLSAIVAVYLNTVVLVFVIIKSRETINC
jgi:hypothetical protein